MAEGCTNWIRDRIEDKTAERKLVDKMESRENKKKKEGWRYFRINGMTEIFIPCNKDGEPTEQGKRMIASYKKAMGL